MKATAIADAMDENGGDCRNEKTAAIAGTRRRRRLQLREDGGDCRNEKTAAMDGDDGKNSEGGID